MERKPRMRHEYRPEQWGTPIPFDGRTSVEQALRQGHDASGGGPGLIRLYPPSEEKRPLIKRLWERITRRKR